MSKFVKILYVNELGPNDYDINLLKSLPGVCDVVVADYRYRVGNYRENKDYLSNLRRQWDDNNQFKPKNIVITHGHIDHSGEIAKTLVDNNFMPNIYCPNVIKKYVYNTINGTYQMSKNIDVPRIHNKYKLIGVNLE